MRDHGEATHGLVILRRIGTSGDARPERIARHRLRTRLRDRGHQPGGRCMQAAFVIDGAKQRVHEPVAHWPRAVREHVAKRGGQCMHAQQVGLRFEERGELFARIEMLARGVARLREHRDRMHEARVHVGRRKRERLQRRSIGLLHLAGRKARLGQRETGRERGAVRLRGLRPRPQRFGGPAELPQHLAHVEPRIGCTRLDPHRLPEAQQRVERHRFALMHATALEPAAVLRVLHRRRDLSASSAMARRRRPTDLRRVRVDARPPGPCVAVSGRTACAVADASTTTSAPRTASDVDSGATARVVLRIVGAGRGRRRIPQAIAERIADALRRKRPQIAQRFGTGDRAVVDCDRALRHVGERRLRRLQRARGRGGKTIVVVQTGEQRIEHQRFAAPLGIAPKPAGTRVAHALRERADRRDQHGQPCGPRFGQREAERLRARRRIHHHAHAVMREEVREIVRLVRTVDDPARIRALPGAMLAVEVPDEHETHVVTALPGKLHHALQPARPLVGSDRAEHGDGGHIVPGRHDGEAHALAPGRGRLARSPQPGRAVCDHGRLHRWKVTRELSGRPARRRDDERRAREQPRVCFAPAHHVDVLELGLRSKTGLAAQRIRLAAAIRAVGTEERDRRATERDVVDRVAVRQAQRRQRLQQAVPTAGDVVQVQELDPERGADPAQEVRPAFARGSREVVPAHVAVVEMLLELPLLADRDDEVMPVAPARAVDERAGVVLRASAVAVDDVQDAAPPGIARRATGRAPLRVWGAADRPRCTRAPSARNADGARAAAPCCARRDRPSCPRTSGRRDAARTHPRTARCGSRPRSRAGRSRSPRRNRGRMPDRTLRSRRSAGERRTCRIRPR